MPNKFYLIRLIHSVERKPAPAKRLWTAEELARDRVVHSLRADNRLGFNVYLWPYADPSARAKASKAPAGHRKQCDPINAKP
jgi:hypothetical protein